MAKMAIASSGIPYSRYFISWFRMTGQTNFGIEEFKEWLESQGLPKEEVDEMRQMFSWGGKFELERSAKPYAERVKERIKRTIGYKVRNSL